MYLSQLFLLQLDNVCSSASVINALAICDKELADRPAEKKLPFRLEKGTPVLSPFGYELLDLWDVYKEFDPLVGKQAEEIRLFALIQETREKLRDIYSQH